MICTFAHCVIKDLYHTLQMWRGAGASDADDATSYMGELEVEYGLTDETWVATPFDDGTCRVISDGLQILFEREPLLSPHQSGQAE
jgi:hypothetical protein